MKVGAVVTHNKLPGDVPSLRAARDADANAAVLASGWKLY